MTQPATPDELATAILALYRGPLDEFVTRRDELAKQLRATKQRESADRVKALRKPSRMAWVLDCVVHEDPASLEQLTAAITEAQTGADLRTALEAVKAAVRGVAAVGARTAVRAGQPIEPNAVIAAMHAVIGNASAFADLRAGQLVEVPEAGGLDMLVATTVREQPEKTVSSSPAPPRREAAQIEAPPKAAKRQDAGLVRAAHADLRRAEVSRAQMSERSENAVKSAQSAEKRLDAAERALLHAQSEAQTRRAELERAQHDADAAAEGVQDAELAVASARARVVEIEG